MAEKIPSAIWAEAERVYPGGGPAAAQAVLEANGYHRTKDAIQKHMARRAIWYDPQPGEEGVVGLPPAFTRRCRNKHCINRFVPVNTNHFFCSPACKGSTDTWTTEEILQEEGSLLPEANHLELARRAFGQKNSALRKVSALAGLRDYLRYEMSELVRENPHLVYPRLEPPKPEEGKRERVVVLLCSDWQMGKLEQGVGIRVMEQERIPRILEATRAIVTHFRNAGYAVNEAHVVFAGDMVEGCVPAGTPILTEHGPVPIEDVKIGQRVWAQSDSGLHLRTVLDAAQTGIKPVLKVHTLERDFYLTSNHAVLTRRVKRSSTGKGRPATGYSHEWVEAGDLVPGDVVVGLDRLPDHGEANGAGRRRIRDYKRRTRSMGAGRVPMVATPPPGCRYFRVVSIEANPIAQPVYNITVDVDHNYIANGIVHRNCWIYRGQQVAGLDRTGNTHRITRQAYVTAGAIADVVTDVASYVSRVVVHSVPGNHGRPNGPNEFADPEDNFDSLCAYWAIDKCANQPNIEWQIEESWLSMFPIMGHQFAAMHGDAWDGPLLPHIEKLLPRWVLGRVFPGIPDVLLTAHRHSFHVLEVNGVTVVQNGTIDGGSLWFTKKTGTMSRPCQTVLVASEKRAVEAIYPIYFN